VNDDAMIIAVTNRFEEISVVHWARIRNLCKSKTLFVDPSSELHLETTMFKYIPVLNLVHDFFDSAPSVAGIQLIMNIVVLVDALVLGIALGLPTAMGGYDSALALIARFNGQGDGSEFYNEWCVKHYGEYYHNWADDECGWSMMMSFTSQATLAASLIGGSILCMVAMYTFFSVSSFDGPNEEATRAMIEVWWRPVLVSVLASIFMTAAGIMYMFGAVKMVATFQFPDYFLDQEGKFEFVDRPNDERNTVNYYNTQSYAWCVSAFLFGVFNASVGLARKSHALKLACEHINNGGELDDNDGGAGGAASSLPALKDKEGGTGM
jgi:hypothetical protein